MKVVVLGAGPSGLVAAHALRNEGLVTMGNLDLFSAPDGQGGVAKSPIWGAQYLHAPIPGLPTPEPSVIRYIWNSEPEPYLRKVYGANWDGSVSDECYTQAHLAYDIRSTYNRLWGMFDGLIVPWVAKKEHLSEALSQLANAYDLILNTLPRWALCVRESHTFNAVPIYALGDSDDQRAPELAAEGEIQYNGQAEPAWYRASQIHGYRTVEWPGIGRKPPYDGVAKVNKPLSHNCDCWSHLAIRHLGRMGRWQNGTLVHHVYPDAIEAFILKQAGEI